MMMMMKKTQAIKQHEEEYFPDFHFKLPCQPVFESFALVSKAKSGKAKMRNEDTKLRRWQSSGAGLKVDEWLVSGHVKVHKLKL